MRTYPTELEEHKAFVDWLNIKGIPHHHSPNETGGGRQNAVRGAKMKRLGTAKGFWDLIIYIPVEGVTGTVDTYEQVMVEMKTRKRGVVSPEQKAWGKIYEKAGIRCRVCRGCDEAIEFIEKIINEMEV